MLSSTDFICLIKFLPSTMSFFCLFVCLFVVFFGRDKKVLAAEHA